MPSPLGNIVFAASVRVGGDKIDEAIIAICGEPTTYWSVKVLERIKTIEGSQTREN